MKEEEILKIVSSELSNSEQNLDFETPLDYYLGNPRGDEQTGRSQVVSTDVADAIEWIKPQIMKSFTQNNEIVIFDPISPDDELQAEIESQYVYEVLMKENNGFVILHQLVTDLLLQNNGFIKVYHQEKKDITKEKNYSGLTPQQLQAVAAQPNAEILDYEEIMEFNPETGQPSVSFKAKVAITFTESRIIVESVDPGDFRCNSDHNSVDMENARFTAHLMTKTISELREEGIPEKIVKKLIEEASSDDSFSNSDYRFAAQGEDSSDDPNGDESTQEVNIAECYMFADLDDDGIAERVKITVGGHSTPNVLIDSETIDYCPWINGTAILMSHKWRGLSIYDRLKQIQDIKTVLLRNTLDNIYLQNNQRHKVIENQVMMSDLMVSRPGGVVRVKNMAAVEPLVTPPVGQDVFTMMNYMDGIRASRAGVSPEGELQQHKIGERVGSQGLERLMSAKEELVGLIIRIVAETAVKPLCTKIRNLCTSHLDAIRDFRFRGQWFQVNPATWPMRSRCTVRVGTGTGNHERKIAAVREILDRQVALQQTPSGGLLVTPASTFKAFDDFCKFSGLNSAVGYLVDPQSPEGQQAAQAAAQQQKIAQEEQAKQMQMQLEFQAKLANAEVEKARAQMLNVELKSQLESAKTQFEGLKQRLEEGKAIANEDTQREKLDLDRDRFYTETGLKVAELKLEDRKIQAGAKAAKQVSEENDAA